MPKVDPPSGAGRRPCAGGYPFTVSIRKPPPKALGSGLVSLVERSLRGSREKQTGAIAAGLG